MGSLTAGPSGAVTILAKSAIPFIGISSGSIAANGALTGITALPTTYANAFIFLPVGAVAPASVAGWYFCQFSAANAGTVFLDRYTAGTPTIPAAPTPVTAGAGAYVGDTGEEFGPTITIPANAMRPNGGVRISALWASNGAVNQVISNIRYSGNAGTLMMNAGPNAPISVAAVLLMQNCGAANIQNGELIYTLSSGSSAVGNPSSSVDTTVNSTIVISVTRANAANNAIIRNFLVELLTDGT